MLPLHRDAAAIMGQVGLGGIDPAQPVGSLGVGQQQLVEIARAIGERAGIMIMDEPTASLSEREVRRLFEVIGDLRRSGAGILYVSHRLDEIFQIADRVTVLRDGAVVATRPIGQLDKGELIRLMVGREVASIYPQHDAAMGDILLETRGLGCSASGLHNIDLAVRAGEIVGLAGLVGASAMALEVVGNDADRREGD